MERCSDLKSEFDSCRLVVKDQISRFCFRRDYSSFIVLYVLRVDRQKAVCK